MRRKRTRGMHGGKRRDKTPLHPPSPPAALLSLPAPLFLPARYLRLRGLRSNRDNAAADDDGDDDDDDDDGGALPCPSLPSFVVAVVAVVVVVVVVMMIVVVVVVRVVVLSESREADEEVVVSALQKMKESLSNGSGVFVSRACWFVREAENKNK
ncbi:hypothetical protein E2C01_068104 [Portunus trituberculatus]|uniref:Uncharacterized protein n=1 Tax=Portunus trituberculatus TaxID=210409 RepID=A0A5B7HX05_PORTR|nr:hypothetical protein [Portunus trituberculatus]